MDQILLQLVARGLHVHYVRGHVHQGRGPHAAVDFISRSALSLVYSPQAPYHCHLPDGTRQTAAAGGCLAVPPGQRHRFDFPGTGDLCGIFIHYSIVGGIDLFRFVQPPLVLAGRRGQQLGSTMLQLVASHQRTSDLATIARRHRLAYRLLELLLEESLIEADAAPQLRRLDQITPALSHMRACLAQPMDRSLLARRCGCSQAQFARLFVEMLGMPPMRYLRQQRLARAEELLLTTDQTLDQIASQVGICDGFQLSKLYKQLRGESPDTLRRRLGLSAATLL